MAATCLTRWPYGFFLLGVLLVVNVCEAAPAAVQGRGDKATTENTALAIIPSTVDSVGKQQPKPEDATLAHKNETALNGTAASNSTHVNGTENEANTTVNSGEGVVHTEPASHDRVHKTPQAPAYYFSSWITWRDNYLMSIMIPVACGVGAAVLILCSLACIGCCRRRCRSRARRKLHKKIDPKTFRKMKAADRIKLLAASSDEEF